MKEREREKENNKRERKGRRGEFLFFPFFMQKNHSEEVER